ncbi:MAG: polyprenyl synthetase family protein [bacterium]|jgi:geranylgeranyl diphosphate synthase type II
MGGTTSFDLKTYLDARRERVDAALDRYLPPEDSRPETLHRAMRYSVFSGGKRIRPVFCMAAYEACGGAGDAVLPVACSLELIHTYSLIHDDLPCMDDDDMRRGKPTSHKVFGEATAVLAGDALLTFAMELVVEAGGRLMDPLTALRIAAEITKAAGSDGMVAGQVLDMECENRQVDESLMEYIHSRKTGKLITASVRCGAIAAGADDVLLEKLSAYGSRLGLAFQIIDDILDEEGSFGELKSGKGLDGERGKATYPKVFGLERSKAAAAGLVADAARAVDGLGEGFAPLAALAEFVASRSS